MTKNLAGRLLPGNLPSQSKFYLSCARCGRRSSRVRFVQDLNNNVCQPKCPEEVQQ